ncbi:AMP-binding protein [Pararhodobacter sp. CCB-MM2]|uniref:AMP-binding protein n=1 Tax=Pararhodobacter sp. CCB-MM2 TaxID=1786003 RepID=UPI000AB20F8B|nr:AMP-binding protein [Pararhodobacter sp. CCB-MM2]
MTAEPTGRLASIITPDATIDQALLQQRASAAAAGFRALGLREGSTVAILMRNDIPFIEASIAAQKIGAFAVPINWHSTAAEILYVLNDCRPDLLVAQADLLATPGLTLPEGLRVIAAATPPATAAAFRLSPEACAVPTSTADWDAFIAAHPPRTTPDAAARGAIIYTSGTTGHPKGVKRVPMDADLLARNVRCFVDTYGLAPDVRTLLVTPLYHASPGGFARYAATRGELLVLVPRFDPEEFLALIEKHRINTITAVPTMFIKLLKLPSEVRARYDLSSLRWVSHTAAACPVDVKKAMIDWWGPILHEVYGGTEVGIAMHCTSPEWLAHPGTVGRVVEGAEVRILGEDDRVLPQGETGEIYVRNPNYADFTYINRPEARAETEKDGFISIGDVGWLDEDGFLFLGDRKRDMIIFGGTNIYPAEIESALVQHPQVADCAVIGLPDPEFGEIVCAWVQPARGAKPNEAEIADFLGRTLARYKLPRRYLFVDSLPREESGKLMKRKLREAMVPG